MNFAQKKVVQQSTNAQDNAQIIKVVNMLLDKQLISIKNQDVQFYVQLWKSNKQAINWMNCLYRYAVIKKQIKNNSVLNFINIENGELLGKAQSGKAKLFISINEV